MPIRVLIFENDPKFAQELQHELQELGCEITIVDDPNMGLQTATTQRPDIILLAIELPKMNGFSVCNRLKRDPNLSTIPVIITSTDATEATFEQHRRLPRTRADDYIKKPVAFPELLNRMRQFVAIGDSAGSQGQSEGVSQVISEDEIVIDDEVDVVGDELQPIESTHPSGAVEQEVDDFTEQAFDTLMEATSESEQPGPSPTPKSSIAVDTTASGTTPAPGAVGTPETSPVSTRSEEAAESSRGVPSSSDPASQVQTLRRELEEARAKLIASVRPTATTSAARELLDMREQLNRKDKELLDLRDRLMQKEKELLTLKDSVLVVEREKTDFAERVDDLSRQLSESQKLVEASRSDKEAAAKREEDAKRRVDKLAAQIEERNQQLTKAQADRQSEAAAREQERQAASEELRQATVKAQEELARRVSETEQAARLEAERALTLARVNAEKHEQQAVSAAEEAAKAHQDQAMRSLEERLRLEAATEREATLAALRHELNAAKDAAVSRLLEEAARDREVALATAREERERSERERDGRITQLEGSLATCAEERDRSLRSVEELTNRINGLQVEVERLTQEGQAARESLASALTNLDHANWKWSEDRASLERLKDALASALLQVEAIEGRPVSP